MKQAKLNLVPETIVEGEIASHNNSVYGIFQLEKRKMMEAISAGIAYQCPCCDEKLSSYRISLSDKLLSDFRWICEASLDVDSKKISPSDARFVDIRNAPERVQRRRSITKLQHFGFIEQKLSISNKGDLNTQQSMWRPTLEGIKFFLGYSKCTISVVVFRGKRISSFGDEVSFGDFKTEVHDEDS